MCDQPIYAFFRRFLQDFYLISLRREATPEGGLLADGPDILSPARCTIPQLCTIHSTYIFQ